MPRCPTAIFATLCLTLVMASAAATAADNYTVEASRSDIHWRIYRAGPLAQKGHSHVISARGFSGSVQVNSGSPSAFQLVIPVAALEVDNPALRRRYGAEFATDLSAEDRAATRANMLGPRLLDGARHPHIRIAGSTTVNPPTDSREILLPVTLSIAGREVRLRIPATISITEREVRATGRISLSHQQLGLRPFSAAMGALRVADRIDFSFDIRATRGR
ncbi:YceI family protein [Microbulbifer yueqingensis]|uniref:YceI-like domain-containing protein n=1 Tax=Microbulbifer yueqingensis TaxID=658219 RepID=A0A1G8UI06_9GAMM|nr:YceI family protein [Microbulbifer yueqingensis]SDJ53473.1 YceI-like domain-containing protein [Microbulbifer yueqingensis]